MHARLPLFALALALALPARAQPSTEPGAPPSERRVSYAIDAVLDPAARAVTATARVTWRNPDAVPVGELQFHLYLNAFRDGSTFMRESRGGHRGYAASRSGRIDVTRLALHGAGGAVVDLTGRLRFIQPDDDNTADRTVAAVTLPQPVAPGETVTLDVDFEATFPRVFARTGWRELPGGGLFFMGAQWFPKLGVYEVPGQRYVPADAPRGRWNTHQFHANTEFYADFGTYEVTLTVPDGYVVGATGVRVAEAAGDGTRTVTYRAEDVHDFAWTASDAFLTYTDTWRHVELRLLLRPEHADQARRHFDAARVGLEYFDRWVGPYPYTTLTLVDGIGGANGMEYPTLITCGTVYGLPAWLRALEVVTIHEFGHQYFYGLLASNEFEEAWLDEGINQYVEARIMDVHYGPGALVDLPGLRIGDRAFNRVHYASGRPGRGALYQDAWTYDFAGDYARNTYTKPATILTALERHLGWDTMRRILQAYYRRWRFRHPTTRDFIAVAEDVSGRDLGWFFDQFVYGTVTVDYEIASIGSRAAAPAADSTRRYESTVVLHRREEGVFPQTLRVRFDDGHTEEVAWDGRDEWKRYTFTREARLAEAYLDPEHVVFMDLDRLNNRRVAEAPGVFARKWHLKVAVWLQQAFYLVAGLM